MPVTTVWTSYAPDRTILSVSFRFIIFVMVKACMKMRCVSIIVLSILLSCLPDVTGLSAATGTREHGRPYSFRRLPGTDGIFSAYAMVQDSSRFLWVGTDMGLVRYDGYRCETYRYSAGDPASLCQDHVNALLYCPEGGYLVAGTDAGVSVYDFSRDEFFPLKACGYRHVKSLLRDGSAMWVGTAEGLLRFDVSEGGLLPDMPAEKIPGLPSEHIACIRKVGDSVWAGAYDHIYRLSPSGEIETFSLPTTGKLVLDITGDPEGSSYLWAGTEQGLFRYRTDGSPAEIFLESIPIKYFFRYELIIPIVVQGDPIGAMVLCSKDDDIGEVERKVAQSAVLVLSRQME